MRNDGREPVLMELLGVKVDKVAGSLFIWRSPSSEAFDYACWPLILKGRVEKEDLERTDRRPFL